PWLPEDDHAIVLPWASVIVIIVLLKLALTCAVPEVMFLRSRRRRRGVAVFAIYACSTSSCRRSAAPGPCACARWCGCAGRAPAIRGGGAARDRSRDPSAA